MGVPAFGTIANANFSTSATSFTNTTMPASIVAGDALIAYIIVEATGKTFAITAGWTIVDSVNTGNVSAAWAFKVAVGGDTAPTWSWTGAASCLGRVVRYTGETTPTIYGAKSNATANSSTSITGGSLTTTANNSRILELLLVSTNVSVPTPTNFTNRGQGTSIGGSDNLSDGPAYLSGATTDPISVTIASVNWASFSIELLGSGTTANEPAERATQVVQEALFSYSNPTNVRATQVAQETLYTYSNLTNAIATQVVIEVLRTQAIAATSNVDDLLLRCGG